MEMITIKEAYDRIEVYYERMFRVSSTSGRKYNYDAILEVMEACPAVKDYWTTREAFNYVDKIRKIKNYKEPRGVLAQLLEWSGQPFDNREYEACAYIVWLEDCNTLKVGKTNNMNTRLTGLRSSYGSIKLLHTFGFDNEEDAYLMEVVLHKYYKKYYKECAFVPQDRFVGADFNSTDLQILENAAEKIRMTKWF
jgi:hypothetical protein